MGPQRLNYSPYGRALTLYFFLSPQQSRYQDMTPGFTTHESSHGRKQKRILNTPVSPLGDPRCLFRTTNECRSNEHPQNLLSEDKISQDRSKEPTQLDRDCTPKQTGDRSSDPWTRRDLSHPGDVNLELANAPTSSCYAVLMMLMIVPCTVNCLTCFVSAQVNKLQHALPVQQRYKTTADHRKYHSPLHGHSMRTLRPETNKRGRPNTPRHPVQQEVARKTSTPLFPKNWASHLLRGEY